MNHLIAQGVRASRISITGGVRLAGDAAPARAGSAVGADHRRRRRAVPGHPRRPGAGHHDVARRVGSHPSPLARIMRERHPRDSAASRADAGRRDQMPGGPSRAAEGALRCPMRRVAAPTITRRSASTFRRPSATVANRARGALPFGRLPAGRPDAQARAHLGEGDRRLRPAALDHLPEGGVRLEKDVFPVLSLAHPLKE